MTDRGWQRQFDDPIPLQRPLPDDALKIVAAARTRKIRLPYEVRRAETVR
jgi:hypothetical protein